MDSLLEWGLSRAVTADLPVPPVDSITFLRARTFCRTIGGLASTGDVTRITLCATPDDICLDEACLDWANRPRHLLLHELAHPWLHESVDEPTRAAFLEAVGLDNWSDPGDRWLERGVERAADTLAYGLAGEPVTLVPEIHGDCEDRDAGFRILTETDPLAPCTDG